MLKPRFSINDAMAGLLCVFVASAAYAHADMYDTGRYQLSVYLGGTTSTIHTGDGLIKLNGETDQFIPKNSQNSNFTWGFGAAYRVRTPQELRDHKFLDEVTLGLEFYNFKTTEFGEIWQYQLPEMNNLTYRFPVNSYRLLATTEWAFHSIVPKTYPFFEAGVGFASNITSFNEAPRPTYESPGLSISNYTQYKLAYTVGGGLKFDLSDWGKYAEGLELSLRYLYANVGNANTGTAANYTMVSPITATLYTQAWTAGLTYIF